jgi:hypothetical protein
MHQDDRPMHQPARPRPYPGEDADETGARAGEIDAGARERYADAGETSSGGMASYSWGYGLGGARDGAMREVLRHAATIRTIARFGLQHGGRPKAQAPAGLSEAPGPWGDEFDFDSYPHVGTRPSR